MSINEGLRVITHESNLIVDVNSIKIPKGAAITITECCAKCDWVLKSLSGKPSVCDHHRIKHLRPFADGTGNTRGLAETDSRPEWCPL